MFALISDPNYFEDFCYVSYLIESLEEIALSYFEQDWYDWFIIIINNEPDIDIKDAIHGAFKRALEYSFDYYKIKEVLFLN